MSETACECKALELVAEIANTYSCKHPPADGSDDDCDGEDCLRCAARAAVADRFPCPCEGLRKELESERERADSNFASCERIKRKFEEATAERDRAKYEAAARLEQTLTQVEMHTRNTKEWRAALDATESERDRLRAELEQVGPTLLAHEIRADIAERVTAEERIAFETKIAGLQNELGAARAYADFEESRLVALCEVIGAEDAELAAGKVKHLRAELAECREKHGKGGL